MTSQPVSLAVLERAPVSVRRGRSTTANRYLTQTDQRPEVGSHGGLVQGCVANAPTRGARTQAASEAPRHNRGRVMCWWDVNMAKRVADLLLEDRFGSPGHTGLRVPA
jgi:hypothetical protein